MKMASENWIKRVNLLIFAVLLFLIAFFFNTYYVWGQTNTTYIALLNGSNVLPPSSTNASGVANITINNDKAGNIHGVEYHVLFKNISNIYTIDLHNAPETVNGTITYSIYDNFGIPRISESSVEMQGPLEMYNFGSSLGLKGDPFPHIPESKPFTFNALERELLRNQTYIDVHTSKFPNGEIRGQFHMLNN